MALAREIAAVINYVQINNFCFVWNSICSALRMLDGFKFPFIFHQLSASADHLTSKRSAAQFCCESQFSARLFAKAFHLSTIICQISRNKPFISEPVFSVDQLLN